MPTTDITITAEDLRLHDQEGNFLPLVRDPFKKHQEAYQQRAQDKNIIFQGRQVGMSTWAASRGFLHAINKPGYCVCFTSQEITEQANVVFNLIESFIESVSSHRPPTKLIRKDRRVIYGQGELLVTPWSKFTTQGIRTKFVQLMDFDWWKVENQRFAIHSILPSLYVDSEVIIHSSPSPLEGGMFKQMWWNAEQYRFTRHFIST